MGAAFDTDPRSDPAGGIFAQVHHSNSIRNLFDHCEIVRDEQVGDADFCLQGVQATSRICAWTRTSSAETGSSQMTKSGEMPERTGYGNPLTFGRRIAWMGRRLV